MPARQSFSLPPENTTCSTGAPVAFGDDARLGLEKVHWSVEREVAMQNDGLSVTSRIVVSAPDSRFENSPSSTPQPHNQCRSVRPKASPDIRPVVVRQARCWYESLPHDDSRRFRESEMQVIDDVSPTIEENGFVIFVGHFGCGKTTLMRIEAGPEHARSGQAVLEGAVVTGPGPRGLSRRLPSPAIFRGSAPWSSRTWKLSVICATACSSLPGPGPVAARRWRCAPCRGNESLMNVPDGTTRE